MSGIGRLVRERVDDARREPILGIGARGVADHPLIVFKLLVEQERVGPVESFHAIFPSSVCPAACLTSLDTKWTGSA
jgi:hypothetical protein